MTAAHAILLGLIIPAYLLGSVPFGLIVARTRGIDPRKAGSGNIGVTNVGRLLGGKFFAIVFTLDLFKGLVPMIAAGLVLRLFVGDPHSYRPADYGLWLLVGFAAIAGHMFSVFLGFKGGKGVATSTGVILGLFPYYTLPAGIAVLAFLVLFIATRYVSVSSMIGSIIFVLAYLGIGLALRWPVFGSQWPLLAFAVLMAALIVYKHRGNLARLRAGTEQRIGSEPRAEQKKTRRQDAEIAKESTTGRGA
ncbi:MAG TPA: glycerol-3-phosphate 1-O-acyltransferase PlsY [Tepidisphaeraceae bacterium]|jgi:glycerol-3-phosphate acyltransferase PlsY